MDILGFLTGVSPWWWVAFAFALGALEMATMSFFLIWPALAALLVALILTGSPDLSAEAQLVTFGVLSVILTIIGRFFLAKFGDGGEESSTLNKRAAHFVGRQGTVLDFAKGEGVIEVEGMRWRAKWDGEQTAAKGDLVRITNADGMVLGVENDA